MQFKHPEIFYFLFLLIIPILVHLFQLRRFKKEYFTNVKFLKELSIQTRKSSKLKKWLLLANRLLLITAVVFAFAQPFFEAKESNNSTNELFVVLDNSFSMQAKGQKGELLQRAVQDLLSQIPEGQTFSLITNSESLWNTDISSAKKDLQQISYSAVPFDLESAMAKVNSRESIYKKDVIVITDAFGILPKQLKSIDKRHNTIFVLPKAEQRSNVAIDSVFLIQTLDNFYEIGVTISASGDSGDEIPVALYNNEKLVAKTIAKISNDRQPLNFMIPKTDFHGYAAIDDNGLEYDNRYYFSIAKPKKLSVVSIGSTLKSDFLSRIYSSADFNYRNFEPAQLDYNLLENQDAIVLNELEQIPQALQTTLKTFAEKGGNIVVIPSADNQSGELTAFLSTFGRVNVGALKPTEKLVTKIAFNHPLYNGVFEKQIDNFQYPKVNATFKISSSAPAVLSFEDQDPFLTSISSTIGTVYIFSAPVNKDNSNFQNSPLIVPTFYNMAQASGSNAAGSITIGKSQPLLVDAALAKDDIVTVAGSQPGSGDGFIPTQQLLSNKIKLTFAENPAKAGNYGIYKQQELLKNISFNYDRTEGNLQRDNDALFTEYTVATSIENVFDKLQTDRTDNEIWKWFIVLAFLLLVTELLIQKLIK